MKTRIGFVSNSSSSSFVLVASLSDHIKACDSLSKDDQDKMRRVCKGIKAAHVGETEVIVISGGDYEDHWNRGHYSSSDADGECPDDVDQYDYWEQARAFWESYIAQLPNNGIIYEWTNG